MESSLLVNPVEVLYPINGHDIFLLENKCWSYLDVRWHGLIKLGCKANLKKRVNLKERVNLMERVRQ